MGGRRLILATAVLLLVLPAGCQVDPGSLLPAEQGQSQDQSPEGLKLVARFAHITDTHLNDTLSPARFAGAHALTRSAWRPYEAYSTQLMDGLIRAVNRIHAGGTRVDFLLHTGDACEQAQSNELQWLAQIMDGGLINPLSGPDDRRADQCPPPELDPYAVFVAEGLYRTGAHGDAPTIPWYTLFGNHDVYALGVFPILEVEPGRLLAPLPAPDRPGWLLPTWLDPLASFTHGRITPAHPGPPLLLECPSYLQPNPERAYFGKAHLTATMFDTLSPPAGHGFAAADGPTWYSLSPAPGLRLIGLDTTDRTAQFPGQLCHDGAVSRTQLEFVRAELEAAAARDGLVVVAAHHPSQTIRADFGVEVTGEELREVLRQYANVVLYISGHVHRNRVIDRGGYLEIETCSSLDLPQEGRIVEIWRDTAGWRVAISYRTFTHDGDDADDRLLPLRAAARAIALADKGAAARQKGRDPGGAAARGMPADREGWFIR